MSDTVIQVENLGKKYIIGHQPSERYVALRDVIARGVKSCLNAVNPLAHARSKPQGSTEEFWALQDVSFEIKQGDRVGIIGRNGAGKSTLLKLLSRITEPTTGSIRIKGRVASLLEVGTGFHPELTGRENIYLNGAILGMGKAEIKRKFDEIVAFAEVERFLDTPVKRYSSGMYVRLAFAVAAHLEPEILVVDEVLAVGDAQFQKKCLGKMEDVGKEGRTVLFVSHNMALIKHLCSISLYLESGKARQFGQTSDIVEAYLAQEDQLSKTTVSVPGEYLVADTDLDVVDFYACDQYGKFRNIFKTSEEVCFAINYKLKKEITGLRVGLDVCNRSGGEVIFRTFDDDVENQSRCPGLIYSLCKIPPDLLKAGTYDIKLQIGIHNLRWITYNSITKQITLESVDGVNSRYSDTRPGFIMPKIPWKLTKS